jgi:hypothetical protein
MDIHNVALWKVAKKIAEEKKLPRAYKYDLYHRELDDMVELIGLVDDPTYNMEDFRGREMLFPKKWVTLDVLEPSFEVNLND